MSQFQAQKPLVSLSPRFIPFISGKICVTNKDGDSKNNACVEGPWKYESDDTEYEGCANPDGKTGGFWCPTKLDSDGRWKKKQNLKDWGYCDMTMYTCNPGGKYGRRVSQRRLH